MSKCLDKTWVRFLLSNIPFLLGLNAARMADKVGPATVPGFFWTCVLLLNLTLWARLTWELVWPPRK